MYEREAIFLKAILNYNESFCEERAETSNAPSNNSSANSTILLVNRSAEYCAVIDIEQSFKDGQWS